MDNKRLIIFGVLALAILLGWQKWLEHRYPQMAAKLAGKASITATASGPAGQSSAAVEKVATPADAAALRYGQRIKVRTDVLNVEIDTEGADLRRVELLKNGEAVVQPGILDQILSLNFKRPPVSGKPFLLMQDQGKHLYVAQTGILDGPNHRSTFTTTQTNYQLGEGQKELQVQLESTSSNGVKLIKTYVFKRGSYQVDVRQDVINGSGKVLQTSAYYGLRRDGEAAGEGPDQMGARAYTGPAVYNSDKKFQKVKFEDLADNKAKYDKTAKDGWVAMVQHYFVSAWLVSPIGQTTPCAKLTCTYDLEKTGEDLYFAAVRMDLPALQPGARFESSMPLYVGPQDTRTLEATAVGLELSKDYGWLTFVAVPIFAVLDFIHAHIVSNWGWAIILLTVMIKALFYPLASASYRSMAKMKKLSPRMQQLKERFGDDKVKFQQAVMEMYKTEKVNPLGGCLPILVQIPVFMALYWVLLAAVELRQAPWLGWITDLSQRDPYLILPVIMAITMYLQTHLSPPPPDPMQAKIMKIVPLVFSIMFFMFPAGLVLYWVVNNTLSITQQWYITRRFEKESAKAANS